MFLEADPDSSDYPQYAEHTNPITISLSYCHGYGRLSLPDAFSFTFKEGGIGGYYKGLGVGQGNENQDHLHRQMKMAISSTSICNHVGKEKNKEKAGVKICLQTSRKKLSLKVRTSAISSKFKTWIWA